MKEKLLILTLLPLLVISCVTPRKYHNYVDKRYKTITNMLPSPLDGIVVHTSFHPAIDTIAKTIKVRSYFVPALIVYVWVAQ